MKAWKEFEQAAARLFNGARFWANAGGRYDFAGTINGHPIKGQCKLVKSLSLNELTKLAEEEGVDVVCVKVRRGSGSPSPALVVFTFAKYESLHRSSAGDGGREA